MKSFVSLKTWLTLSIPSKFSSVVYQKEFSQNPMLFQTKVLKEYEVCMTFIETKKIFLYLKK